MKPEYDKRSCGLWQCAIAVVLAFTISLAADDAEDLGLKLLEINEGVNESGKAMFFGKLHNSNASQHALSSPSITIILKQGEKVVGVYQEIIVGLGPGLTWEFEVETNIREGGYDQYSYILHAYLGGFDKNLVAGELVIVESSVTITSDEDGNAVVLGEMVNNTNAVLSDIVVRFILFDDQDRVLGKVFVLRANGQVFLPDYYEMMPGERIFFEAWSSDVPFGKVERWELDVLIYTPIRLYHPGVATARKVLSWGEIKKGNR